MPYHPLKLDSSLMVDEFLAARVEPYIEDVHAMLRLPLPEIDVDAACNFTATLALCAVIGGLSRLFYPEIKASGRAFRRVIESYDASGEPEGAITGQALGEALHEVFRNDLVHSLGVNFEWDDQSKRHYIQSTAHPAKIVRCVAPLSAEKLEELESSDKRPAWLAATMAKKSDGTTALCVEALYRGTRSLVLALAANHACRTAAEQLLIDRDFDPRGKDGESLSFGEGNSGEVDATPAPNFHYSYDDM